MLKKQHKSLFYKSISTLLTALIIWTYMIFAPHQEVKELEHFLGPSRAYAASVGTFELADPNAPSPPLPVDLTEPDDTIKFSWARIAGREDAVYLNIPSNQISDKVYLPQEPSLMVLGKYDPSTATGTMALMRMRQVGPNIQAEILRITPKNFQHYFGPHLYQFAFLNWNGNSGCDYGEKHLHDLDPPNVNNEDIMRGYNKYDLEYNIQYDVPTTLEPTPVFKFRYASQQHKINRSNFYWHQRLNDDPCWTHVALRDFDKNNDMFNDISHYAFLKLITIAQHIHKAPVGFLATPKTRQTVDTSTKKSAFKKKVTTTVRYWLSPEWTVSTPKAFPNMYSDYEINATWDTRGTYAFVKVQGDHTFPVDETLIYEWSESKSGWTGFFVLLAITFIGVALGGIAFAGSLYGILVGAAVGAIGGLVASGFSPTTSTTAQLTPFSYSAYQLDPSASMSGDAKAIADRTRSNWIMPDSQNTPGGVQKFIMKLDMRKILKAGSVTATDNVSDDTSSAVEVVKGDDPRFKTIFDEMFYKPQKMLQKYKYPYDTNPGSVSVPAPVQ
ncbi:MAG: hypothetical protein AB1325_03955 [Nitrospirota bacterium]